MITCDSLQIIKDFYGRMVIGDVLPGEKNLGGSEEMLIEVRLKIFREVITGTLKISKCELELNGNLRLQSGFIQ